MRKFWISTLLLILCIFVITGCTSASSTATAAPSTNPTSSSAASTIAATSSSSSTSASVADGKTLLETRCVSCHTLAKVVTQKMTAARWQQEVNQMVQRGAVLSSTEETVLVQYLADNFK